MDSREENKILLFGIHGMREKKGLAGGIMGFLHDNNVNVMSVHVHNELVVLRGGAKALDVPGNYFKTSVAGSKGNMTGQGLVEKVLRFWKVSFYPVCSGWKGLHLRYRASPGFAREVAGVDLRLFQGRRGLS